MHRTTTTAALLVTVAVSALSGCVTVQRPATPGPLPDTAPSRLTAAQPDGSAQPRVVQAPAREALEMAGPSRHPHRTAPAAPHRAEPAPPAAHRPPAPPTHPRPRPEPAHRPPAEPPNVSRPARGAEDLCALGRKYGGWRGDSPESVICERTYGR
ncbi:hypothetical protein [Streptomyces collinus]|uniref:hypothetical protein n=1 Tax=Streptomyces collinus TaxID=42684 RepID=UPI0038004D64